MITKIPTKSEIYQAVVRTHSDYYGLVKNTKPLAAVDIEALLETVYEVNIIPTGGLEREHGVDAVTAADFKTVYVDMDRYLDDRYQKRMRFSLAHELGHIQLHKGLLVGSIGRVDADSIRGFHFSKMNDQLYDILEKQANDFAGKLLVPEDSLICDCAILVRENIDILMDSRLTVEQILQGLGPRLTKNMVSLTKY